MEEFVVTFVDLYRGMYFLVHAIDTCLLRQNPHLRKFQNRCNSWNDQLSI